MLLIDSLNCEQNENVTCLSCFTTTAYCCIFRCCCVSDAWSKVAELFRSKQKKNFFVLFLCCKSKFSKLCAFRNGGITIFSGTRIEWSQALWVTEIAKFWKIVFIELLLFRLDNLKILEYRKIFLFITFTLPPLGRHRPGRPQPFLAFRYTSLLKGQYYQDLKMRHVYFLCSQNLERKEK